MGRRPPCGCETITPPPKEVVTHENQTGCGHNGVDVSCNYYPVCSFAPPFDHIGSVIPRLFFGRKSVGVFYFPRHHIDFIDNESHYATPATRGPSCTDPLHHMIRRGSRSYIGDTRYRDPEIHTGSQSPLPGIAVPDLRL